MERFMSNHLLFLGLSLIIAIGQVYADEEDQFPREEYEHYMKLIKELDPKAYARLKQCEADTGMQCIEKASGHESAMITFPSEETKGYPFIVIPSLLEFNDLTTDEVYQKSSLNIWLPLYNDTERIVPMTAAERKKIMEAIKSVDPAAYEAIVKVDPTGENHISRDYTGSGGTIDASVVDGLPDLRIDPFYSTLPFNELRAVIAHELAHYVLGHFFESYRLTHRILKAKTEGAQSFGKKGKKVAGQLPFKETFTNARQRVEENECDRMAIIEFGIPIDDAIAQANRVLIEVKEKELKNPQKETFQSTHPLWAARIKHLESLRPEVELRKAQKKQRKPIDYEALAKKYLKKYEKENE
jgi:hypothetical protein